MKNVYKFAATLFAIAVAHIPSLHAQLAVPSDGSDGDLVIAADTTIDLSLASTGTWSQDNSANAGKGVYDPEKWAVVFKYNSVSIAANATVRFSNHRTHAPVVWLVKGNVEIGGGLRLDGNGEVRSSPEFLAPTEPGPGGFRGGATGPAGVGAGYGIGGAWDRNAGFVGVYGNPQIMPLIGGSGIAGQNYFFQAGGASGGGAILIAASGDIAVNGFISADGSGWSINDSLYGYSTGGAIRLVANNVQGSGNMSAARTRVEANTVSPRLNINPNTTAVPPGSAANIWPPDTAPIVKIVNVDTQTAPADPNAAVLTSSDVTIGTNAPVNIRLETKNFPPSGLVQVRVTPKYGNFYVVTASNVSGDFNSAFWQATTTFPNGFCTLQAHATSP